MEYRRGLGAQDSGRLASGWDILAAMPVLIAMLRGVNVGGHHKIKMDVLRELCHSAKFEWAQTYLQSGNVIFRTGSRNLAEISEILERAIEKRLGFRPAVVVRSNRSYGR